MKKGKFIVFEGIDGCGKSTQAERACEYLKKRGVKCAVTCEPTDGEMGVLLRRYLKGKHKANPCAIASLFAADRIDHITKDGGICDLLNRGITVLCDRYYLSSCAYQGTDCDISFVLAQNKYAKENAEPDLTVYIDITPDVAVERISKRGEVQEVFEKKEKLDLIYSNYQKLISEYDGNIIKVDGDRSKDAIQKDIEKILDNFIY